MVLSEHMFSRAGQSSSLVLCQMKENKCVSSIHLDQLKVTGSISTLSLSAKY